MWVYTIRKRIAAKIRIWPLKILHYLNRGGFMNITGILVMVKAKRLMKENLRLVDYNRAARARAPEVVQILILKDCMPIRLDLSCLPNQILLMKL